MSYHSVTRHDCMNPKVKVWFNNFLQVSILTLHKLSNYISDLICLYIFRVKPGPTLKIISIVILTDLVYCYSEPKHFRYSNDNVHRCVSSSVPLMTYADSCSLNMHIFVDIKHIST